MGNGHNNALSNQSHQECVEALQITTTRQANHECCNRQRKGILRMITVTTKQNATDNIFVAHCLYIAIWEERDLSWDTKNVMRFYTV